MAGDWIKMKTDLASTAEVIDLVGMLGLDAFEVVGRLWALWAWADGQTSTGKIRSLNPDALLAHIDGAIVRATGFSAALISCGWLRAEPGGIVFVNFRRHNGKSAKQRALARDRMRRTRRNERCAGSATKSAPEKRREEKSINTPLTPQGGNEGDDALLSPKEEFRKQRLNAEIEAAMKLKPLSQR